MTEPSRTRGEENENRWVMTNLLFVAPIGLEYRETEVRKVNQMRNVITKSKTGLIAAADVVKTALTDHAETIGLVHVTPEMVDDQLVDLIMACGTQDGAKLELTARRVALRLKAKEAQEFVGTTRDVLKPHLGAHYGESWNGSGFVNSLAIPRKADKLQPVVGSLKNYLTLRPAQENAALNVTALRAGTLFTELGARRAAVSAQEATSRALVKTANAKAAILRGTLRTLLDEMALKLDPTDTLWLAFGFNMPGQKQTPDVPQNVSATLLAGNLISVKWDSTPRANHYRVWKKVIGVDVDYVSLGSSADLDFLIEGLPGNADVEVLISAVNNGGESQKSTAILVHTL